MKRFYVEVKYVNTGGTFTQAPVSGRFHSILLKAEVIDAQAVISAALILLCRSYFRAAGAANSPCPTASRSSVNPNARQVALNWRKSEAWLRA